MKVTSEILIHQDISSVYDTYFDIQKWEIILSDVLKVEIIKNSESYQEFFMTVEKNFNIEKVHSIRKCKKNVYIEVTQPVPPPQVKKMRGLWSFIKISEKVTKIIATREFEIIDTIDNENYMYTLQNSLSKNLNHFKSFIEEFGVIEVTTKVNANINNVQNLFWDISKWNMIWNPIQNVQMDFDNDFLQKFSMEVERNNNIETVVTIQEKLPNNDIYLYSTTPPPKLSVHHGLWKFNKLSDGTGITCRRVFKMDQEHQSEFVEYKKNFQSRLRNILKSFEEHYDSSKEKVI